MCGRIAWVNDANRRPSQCNMRIVWGLAFKGASPWGDGSILDPDDGNTYRLAASLEPGGELGPGSTGAFRCSEKPKS